MTDTPQPLTDREQELLDMLRRVVRVAEINPPTIGEIISEGDKAIDAAGLNPWCLAEGLASKRDRFSYDMARGLIERIEEEASEAAQAQAEAWQEWGKE